MRKESRQKWGSLVISARIPDKLRDILSQLHDKERDTTDQGDGE